MVVKYLAVLLCVFLVSACTTIAGTGDPPEGVATSVRYGTHAVIGKCPSEPAESAIAAAIGASVVSKGVSRIGAAIAAAANEQTNTAYVRRNVELTSDGLGPCLLVARGWFFKDRSSMIAGTYQDAGGVFNYDGQPSNLHQQGLWLAATPDFFFEGKMVAAGDGSALSMLPAYAYMGKPMASRFLRPGDARSILVAFAISKPAKDVDLSKGNGATVVLGRFDAGSDKEYSTDAAAVFTCDQQGCPKSPVNQLIRAPNESEWFSVPLTDKAQPMTLQVLVSETQSASKFLTFVGEVFSDVEKDLTTELQQALIPSVGDAADESEATAAENALNAYEEKYAGALAKLVACQSAGTDMAKAAAAKKAMRETNQKARAADQPEPFSDSDIDGIVVKAGGNSSAACRDALQ